MRSVLIALLFTFTLFNLTLLYSKSYAQTGERRPDEIEVRPMWFTNMLGRYYNCLDRLALPQLYLAMDKTPHDRWPRHHDHQVENWTLDDENLILRQKHIYRFDRFEGSGLGARYSWDNQVEFEIEFNMRTGDVTVHYEADKNDFGFVEGEETFILGDLPHFDWRFASPFDGSPVERPAGSIRNSFLRPTLRLGSTYPVAWWRRPGGSRPPYDHENNLLEVDRREWTQCIGGDDIDNIPEDLFQAPEGNPFDMNLDEYINDKIRNSVYELSGPLLNEQFLQVQTPSR